MASLDLIVEMRFGAHLYGTEMPESDLDVKGVYLPDGRDILLQRVSPTVTFSPAKTAVSLQRYLELLAAGAGGAMTEPPTGEAAPTLKH